MPRKTSATEFVIVCVLLVAGSALGTGNGDYCVHLSNGITGPDTALIGFENTLEIWIANDDLLGGIGPAIEITFDDTLLWDMEYGSHPPVNEEGRAVGAWNLPDLQFMQDFDNVSPEHLLISGASMPGSGLPAGPSEICYTLKFSLPEGTVPSSEEICATPYCWPPVGCMWWTDSAGGYPPTFCGMWIFSEQNPEPPIVCFAVVELPWICGDAERDGRADITDVVFLVAYVYAGGEAPEPVDLGDVDCDGTVQAADILYLVAYIFAGGPEPCAGCP